MFATLLRSTWRNLQKRYPGILFHGNTNLPGIALTFDDGPHPRDTPRVLEVLAKHDVRSTFFLIGESVERYPHLVKQIHDRGHQLGLHCYRHIPFPLESASTLKGQLDRSRIAIADACGVSPDSIRDIRPPYGIFSKKNLSLLNDSDYRLVLWDNMPLHFLQPVSWTVKQIEENVSSGSIIVLHDGKGHGAKVAAIVDTIIPMLKAMEFDFIRIDDMERNG